MDILSHSLIGRLISTYRNGAQLGSPKCTCERDSKLAMGSCKWKLRCEPEQLLLALCHSLESEFFPYNIRQGFPCYILLQIAAEKFDQTWKPAL